MAQSKSRPRKTRKNQAGHADPIQRLNEWQEHLYDPGHFTGGNIDPLLTGPRPNRYGYILILAGEIMLVFMIITLIKAKHSWPILIAGIPFTGLVLLAGFKLIKKPGPKYDLEKRVKSSSGSSES
jgi:hypothetical protein